MPKYRKRWGYPTLLAYTGVVRTEGDGRPVREGEYSSFRTQPFPQGGTFLCVASRVGDVLGVRTFVILFQFAISPTVTYVRRTLNYRVFAGCATKPGRKGSTTLLELTLSAEVAFAQLALLRPSTSCTGPFKTSKRIALRQFFEETSPVLLQE